MLKGLVDLDALCIWV